MARWFIIIIFVLIANPGNSQSDNLTKEVNRWINTPYRIGGESLRGADCSGFVRAVYRNVYDIDLPRTVKGQARIGTNVSIKRLEPGDLVFFRPYHVGIYIGDGRFVHASVKFRRIRVSDLNRSYWQKNYWKSKRIRR